MLLKLIIEGTSSRRRESPFTRRNMAKIHRIRIKGRESSILTANEKHLHS